MYESPLFKAAVAALLPAYSTLLFYLIYWSSSDLRFAFAYGDPDYGYLFNSLMILDAASPWHIDHPGTPVQLLGALLMLVHYAVAGTEASLRSDFFLHSAQYHRTMLTAAFFVFAASQWFCGWRLLRSRVAPLSALAAQASPFFFYNSLVYLVHWSPETWISSFSLLLIPMLWGGHAVASGLLIGLILSLKIYALPLVLLIFALRGPRQWLVASAWAAFAFVNITAVIWPRYQQFLGWLLRLASHEGNYGTGAMGSPSLGTWIFNATRLYEPELVGLLVVLAVAIPLLVIYGRKREAPRLGPEFLATIGLLALALRHNPVPRYLIPLVPALGLLLARTSFFPAIPRALVPMAAVGVLALYTPKHLRFLFTGLYELRHHSAEVQGAVDHKYKKCALIFTNTVPIEAYALFSGHLATNLGPYQTELNSLYPRFFFPSIGPILRDYSHEIWTAEEQEKKLAPYPCRAYFYDKPGSNLLVAMPLQFTLPKSPYPPYRIGDTLTLVQYVDTPVSVVKDRPGHRVIRKR